MGNDDHLKDAFAFFDQNKSGYIEIDELREALSDELETNNEEVVAAILHDVDTDKVCPIHSVLSHSFSNCGIKQSVSD